MPPTRENACRPDRRIGSIAASPHLHGGGWVLEDEAAGLARNATYLLRPDTYVALADPVGAPDAIERYCADHEITPTASR